MCVYVQHIVSWCVCYSLWLEGCPWYFVHTYGGGAKGCPSDVLEVGALFDDYGSSLSVCVCVSCVSNFRAMMCLVCVLEICVERREGENSSGTQLFLLIL